MKIKPSTLYQIICASFCVLVVMSNLLSAKMVKLPFFALNIPAGLITYPLTFLLSDLVTEIYGSKRSKFMIYIALALSVLSFLMIQMVSILPAYDAQQQQAFEMLLGLSSIRIFSSLIAYITSQVIDIYAYAMIKKHTTIKFLWLRSNGSTWLSQVVDTLVVDILFLYWGLHMPLSEVFPIMLFSYLYKAFFSVATTPLFYLGVFLIQRKVFTKSPATAA